MDQNIRVEDVFSDLNKISRGDYGENTTEYFNRLIDKLDPQRMKYFNGSELVNITAEHRINLLQNLFYTLNNVDRAGTNIQLMRKVLSKSLELFATLDPNEIMYVTYNAPKFGLFGNIAEKMYFYLSHSAVINFVKHAEPGSQAVQLGNILNAVSRYDNYYTRCFAFDTVLDIINNESNLTLNVDMLDKFAREFVQNAGFDPDGECNCSNECDYLLSSVLTRLYQCHKKTHENLGQPFDENKFKEYVRKLVDMRSIIYVSSDQTVVKSNYGFEVAFDNGKVIVYHRRPGLEETKKRIQRFENNMAKCRVDLKGDEIKFQIPKLEFEDTRGLWPDITREGFFTPQNNTYLGCVFTVDSSNDYHHCLKANGTSFVHYNLRRKIDMSKDGDHNLKLLLKGVPNYNEVEKNFKMVVKDGKFAEITEVKNVEQSKIKPLSNINKFNDGIFGFKKANNKEIVPKQQTKSDIIK